MLAREGRVWDVYRTDQQLFTSSSEGRNPRVNRVGLWIYWVVALLAIAGLVLLRRRRAPLAVLAAPILLVAWSAMLTYGSTRFRFAAEPALVVLAAVTLEAGLRALERRRRPRDSAAEPPAPPERVVARA